MKMFESDNFYFRIENYLGHKTKKIIANNEQHIQVLQKAFVVEVHGYKTYSLSNEWTDDTPIVQAILQFGPSWWGQNTYLDYSP